MENPVIEKIRKLFALADGNSNINEASAAAAMAQELMFKHKLAMADIDAPDEPEDVLGSTDFDAPGHLWKKSLVHGVARAFYCRSCTLGSSGKNKTVRIVGKLSDTQSATYMARYLINEIERLAKQECPGQGRRFANSFKVGAVVSILDRLQTQRKEQDKVVEKYNESAALVLKNDAMAVNKYYKELFPKTVKGNAPRATDGGAFEAGQEAGNSVSLGGGRGLKSPAKQIAGS